MVWCLNIAPIENAWCWPQWNMPSWFITHTEKAWFYQRLLSEMVIVMVKIKKYTINDTISIKISFMDYMKGTIEKLPVVAEKFEVVYIFLLLFFFSLSFSIGKSSIWGTKWGLAWARSSLSIFTGLINYSAPSCFSDTSLTHKIPSTLIIWIFCLEF